MVGIAMALILVGNPIQIGTQNVSEPQQAVICDKVVQSVGSEINEVNEPVREIPQVGYITINDVADAWDIVPSYTEQEKYVLVDTIGEQLGGEYDERNK